MSPAQVTVWSPSGPSGLTVLRSGSHCQLDLFMTIHDFSVFLEVPAVPEPSSVASSRAGPVSVSSPLREPALCGELHLLELQLSPHRLDLLQTLRPVPVRARPPDPGPALCEK